MSFATMADGGGMRCAPKRLLISNAVEPTVADALPPKSLFEVDISRAYADSVASMHSLEAALTHVIGRPMLARS